MAPTSRVLAAAWNQGNQAALDQSTVITAMDELASLSKDEASLGEETTSSSIANRVFIRSLTHLLSADSMSLNKKI